MDATLRQAFNSLIGKTVVAIALTTDRTTLTFMFNDGTAKCFEVLGWSQREYWLQHVQNVTAFIGHPITSIEELANVTDPYSVTDEYNYLTLYGVVLNTSGGILNLEWLNASNPAYGNAGILLRDCPPVAGPLLTADL